MERTPKSHSPKVYDLTKLWKELTNKIALFYSNLCCENAWLYETIVAVKIILVQITKWKKKANEWVTTYSGFYKTSKVQILSEHIGHKSEKNITIIV